VTHSLASEAWTTKEHAVGPSRVQLSELIEGDDLTARSEDACASSLGDTQSTDLETLGALEHAHIVGDSAHDHSHLALLLAHELGKLGDGKWRPVVTAHEEALEDDFVEVGLGAASEETVELHEKTDVHVLCGWCFTVAILDAAAGLDVDTQLVLEKEEADKKGKGPS